MGEVAEAKQPKAGIPEGEKALLRTAVRALLRRTAGENMDRLRRSAFDGHGSQLSVSILPEIPVPNVSASINDAVLDSLSFKAIFSAEGWYGKPRRLRVRGSMHIASLGWITDEWEVRL